MKGINTYHLSEWKLGIVRFTWNSVGQKLNSGKGQDLGK